MDIFKTPGGTLLGNDKIQYDDVKLLIEKGTNDFLIKADWDSNIACVDKINSLIGSNTLPELIFLLRRKLSVREARQVMLTLQLIESLVKNCGNRFHNAMNEDKFMKEMASVTHRFTGKTVEFGREATDLALDLIQAWGEAFLPKQNQYTFIVKTYMDLRKSGTHFKEKQFDPDRMPILTEGIGRPTNKQSDADAILAATMHLELNASASSMAESLNSASEDEFSSSFYNSSVYQGHSAGKMTGSSPKKTAVHKRPTPQHHQQQHQHHQPATHKKEHQRKDSFDPSMYPDYDFGDSKAPVARPPVTKQASVANKRDSFDPSEYPDYDFGDVSHPIKPVATTTHKKAPPPLNKRSSFDPSQYPDYNFNDDSHTAAPKPVDTVGSMSVSEVVQSFTFSLSILKDLVMACTHERELRGNEVAREVVKQVGAMEGRMEAYIEHALVHETERVEQLFALNEDAQTVMNVFNMLVTGTMTLVTGKAKLAKISLLTNTPPPPVAATKKPLIDHDEHKSHHPPQQQNPNREQLMHAAHQQPSQRQHAAPVQTAPTRPPLNTGNSAAFKLAPPPKVDSIYGKDGLRAGAEGDIIELDADCMTSPQALDALFEDPAVLKARGTPLGIHIAHTHNATEPAKFDPFSPDALDALFDKPVVKSTPRANATPRASITTPTAASAPAKFDPFSPDALDALFDKPTPALHASAQSPRSHVPPPVPLHHQTSQNGHHQPHQQYAQAQQQYQQQPTHYQPDPHYGGPYQQSSSHQQQTIPHNTPSLGSVRPPPIDPHYATSYQQSSLPHRQSPSSRASPTNFQQHDPHYAQYQQQQQHQQQPPQYYAPQHQQVHNTTRGQSVPVDPHYGAPHQQHPAHYPPQQYGAPQGQYPPQGGYGYSQQQQAPHQQQTGYAGQKAVAGDNANPFDGYYENN